MSADPHGGRAEERTGPRRVVLWFFLFGALLAGAGFGFKIYEFADDALVEQGIGFAGAHLVTYAFVATGFLLLLAGTFLRGHYADIEQPKYDLLEREREHDRTERPGARHGR